MLLALRAIGATTLVLAISSGLAPFQCASRTDPEHAVEEEPGEALYGLAEQFHRKGDERARLDTLRYLMQKYPTSRFALMAKQDLAAVSTSEGASALAP